MNPLRLLWIITGGRSGKNGPRHVLAFWAVLVIVAAFLISCKFGWWITVVR